jgi:PPM family protein phosphatase
VKFVHAHSASQGARRNQEDTAGIWPGGTLSPFLAGDLDAAPPLQDGVLECHDGQLLAVLADGMGGHAGGALASRLTCDAFIDAFVRGTGDSVMRLGHALNASNAALAEKIQENPRLNGMGSTLIGTHFTPDGLHWVSVGDSPLYLFRRGELALLNEDHSLAPEIDKLAAAGKLSWDMARADPRRHFLRSAVTGEDIEMIDRSERALALSVGDIVILASDGLHTLDDEAVAAEIARHEPAGAEAIAKALVAGVLAINQPHQDNITIVVVQVAQD